MPDRSIVARLRADASQLLSAMGKSAKATREVGTAADQTSKKASKSFDDLGKSIQKNAQHIDKLGNAALGVGGTIAAGLGFGVKAFADFDQAMSAVTAALPDAGAEMDKLRQLAIKLGADSQFSATEAAQGITELAKAGVSAADILGGGLKGSLDLAAAGQLSVADAAETAASAITQFGLRGDQVGHVADLLAAGAGKAQGSVADLGMALAQSGLVANATGLTIEETTAGLAAFAKAGLVGSDAGTSFKSTLQRLTPQSQEAATMMENLGISAYDAQGNFIGLANFAGNLQTSLKDLTPEARNTALTVIFGSDAVRAANILYENGATGIAKWQAAVNSAGFAAKQAAALTDNLKGDLERLGGAIDSVFVSNGAGANDALRGLTQGAKSLVEQFGALPSSAQQTAISVSALTSAGLLAAGAFAKIVTTAASFSESLTQIRTESPKAAKGIDLATKAAKGLFAATVALSAAGAATGDISKGIGVEKLTSDILGAGDAIDAIDAKFASAAVFDDRKDSGVTSLGEALRATFNPDIVEQVDNTSGALYSMVGGENLSNVEIARQRLSELDSTLTGLVSSGSPQKAATVFSDIAEKAKSQGISVDELKAKFPQYTEALAAASNQQVTAADSGKKVGRSLEDIQAAAEDAKKSVSDLADEIRGFGSAAISADEARSNFEAAADAVEERLKKRVELQKQLREEQAKTGKDRDPAKIAALNAELKDYALTLDVTTKAGRDNRDILVAQAKATLEMSATTLEQTGSSKQAAAAVAQGRTEFIKSAIQMGATKKEAEALADKYGLIPASVVTVVKAQGAATARKSVQELVDSIKALNNKTVTVGVRYVVTDRGNGSRSTAGGLTADADGGMHLRGAAGLMKAYADGGVWDGSLRTAQPKIAKAGGAGILWAEEGAGPWEAFISGHPNKRARSRVIAEDTVTRLGGQIQWARPFADGGMYAGSTHTETTHAPVIVQKLVASDVDDFRRKAAGETSWRRSVRGSM